MPIEVWRWCRRWPPNAADCTQDATRGLVTIPAVLKAELVMLLAAVSAGAGSARDGKCAQCPYPVILPNEPLAVGVGNGIVSDFRRLLLPC